MGPNCVDGKIICAACNIILLCAAVGYGSYYLYKKHQEKKAESEEKKQQTEGLVEEPAEAPATSA